MIEIKSRWDESQVLHTFEKETLREAVIEAVEKRVDLRNASLRNANLVGASLRNASLRNASLDGASLDGASLDGASLDGASLDGASLDGASLDGASLRNASLDGASLDGASLDGASLRNASLRNASLRNASLRNANLVGASLVGASLVGASLDGASLDGASLRNANLVGASLVGASLVGAELSSFKNDFFEVLLNAPGEVGGLREKLIAGEIDGTCYSGECACLVGSLKALKAGHPLMTDSEFKEVELPGITPNSSRPIEVWFYNISPGCTPKTNAVAAITLEWIDEFQAKLAAAVKALAPVQ